MEPDALGGDVSLDEATEVLARTGRAIPRLVEARYRRGWAGAFDITPETTARSRERVDMVFDEVGSRLADGRPFLVGERFSAADLTFAALAAPVLLPPECPAYPPVADMPVAMRNDVERWRATAAGRFGLAMYARWRRAGRQ